VKSSSATRLDDFLLLFGVSLLSFYAATRLDGLISSRVDLNRFWREQAAVNRAESPRRSSQDVRNPDFRLWSGRRIAAYKTSLNAVGPPVLAVLRIPAIHLEVPVLQGTDDFVLNRGTGHIEGTPEPGHNGNVGIAGHRDGFFRGLKDVHEGDAIELITPTESRAYVVDEILVVNPEDVSVLRPRSKASLTLVTCYPFYFVGSAPQRFIVHASVAGAVGPAGSAERSSSAKKGGDL
jgi:sortase A